VTPDLDLRAPAQRVSPRARWYWAVRAGAAWAVVLGVQVVAWVGATRPGRAHLIVGTVTVLVAATHLSLMPQWRYRVHRWESTATAVYNQSGWFTQKRRIAPVARIQTVDTHRGPWEQVFGLANVTVTTASAAGPLKIHGLDRTVADALVQELTVRTQAAGGDGT
jgi:membrane protein YdbS with pleckstrin-like domain